MVNEVRYPNPLCGDCGGKGYYEDGHSDQYGPHISPCESCSSDRCEMESDHAGPADLPSQSPERLDLFYRIHSVRHRPGANTIAKDVTFCSHDCARKYFEVSLSDSTETVIRLIEGLGTTIKECPLDSPNMKILTELSRNTFNQHKSRMLENIRIAEDAVRWVL